MVCPLKATRQLDRMQSLIDIEIDKDINKIQLETLESIQSSQAKLDMVIGFSNSKFATLNSKLTQLHNKMNVIKNDLYLVFNKLSALKKKLAKASHG